MNFRLFQYSIPAPPDLEDLNSYLQTHRIASVGRHVVLTASGAMLIFIVETVDSGQSRPGGPASSKVDYRELMTGDEFSISDLAEVEGVGPARIEKYGSRLIEILSELSAPAAAGGESP